MDIRSETPGEAAEISAVITEAFTHAPHSDGTESLIVGRLRSQGALSLSLVALSGQGIIGHIAFSPVTVTGRACGWFGLAPLSVRPDRQGQGVGTALVQAGLAALRRQGAAGVVVLGDPGFYTRFGFAACADLQFPGPPPEYFQAQSFCTDMPVGEVAYHPAFFS